MIIFYLLALACALSVLVPSDYVSEYIKWPIALALVFSRSTTPVVASIFMYSFAEEQHFTLPVVNTVSILSKVNDLVISIFPVVEFIERALYSFFVRYTLI